jgi:hypothetical protein
VVTSRNLALLNLLVLSFSVVLWGPHFIDQGADNRTNLIFVTGKDDDVIRKAEARRLQTAAKHCHKVDDLVGGNQIRS